MDRDRNDQGRYADRIDPDTVREVFDARDDHAAPVTATDVVDELDIARRTAHNKLNALVERGVLKTRKVGARGRVWWIPISDDDLAPGAAARPGGRDDAEGDVAAPDRDPVSPTGEDGTRRERVHAPPDDAGSGEGVIDDVLDGWRPGRSPGEKREQRSAAGRAALEYLRDRGAATAAEFRADVEPEHPVDEQSPETWWKKTAREALQRGRDAGVVAFKDGVKEWRWVGGDPDTDE